MLDLINRHLHGFVAVPVVLACRRGGLFDLLGKKQTSFATIVRELDANSGHLAAALRLLQSLRWVERQGTNYCLTAAASGRHHLTEDILSLYPLAIAGDLRRLAPPPELDRWVQALQSGWNPAPPDVAHLMNGAVLIPVLNAFAKTELLAALRAEEAHIPQDWPQGLTPALGGAIERLLRAVQWIEGEGAQRAVTPVGRFMAERALITGTTASYAPLLLRLPELLFGDAEAAMARDEMGRERHLDRTLNVVASGFQHQKFFADLDELVLAIFDREPIEEQPDWIVDTGCGDGSLLRRIHEVVRTRSRRGWHLAQRPLVMVGVDYNEAALAATARTLTDIPHLLLQGDISDPRKLMADLRAQGILDPDRVLHVRSFLDHDRPSRAVEDPEAAAARTALPFHSVSVAADGSLMPPQVAVQSLVEHLGRWAGVIGRHGLILLEVHCLDPEIVALQPDRSENLHFDAYHAFSHQHLVEADVFLLAAGEAGLLPRRDAARIYPRADSFVRITLDRFDLMAWRVRLARQDDLPALTAIEAACWPEPLRETPAELARRLAAAPGLQLVAEQDGRVVGVIWAQRIAGIAQLRTVRHVDLAGLARADGPVVQLLGMNVLPDAQDVGIGSRLLDFALQWYRRKSGVVGVAGITRCRNYEPRPEQTFEAYVRGIDAHGRPHDPVLAFHAQHGAVIHAVVPDFRPEDTANSGHGVLIEHAGASIAGVPLRNTEAQPGDLLAVLDDCMRTVLHPRSLEGCSRDRPLRDMGFDSLDLLELRTLLTRRLGRELEPTFFFNYGSPAKIVAALRPTPGQPPATTSSMRARQPRRATHPEPAMLSATAAEPIAIIGAGCRFPGGVDDPQSFHRLLEGAVDAIGPVPADRFDVGRLHDSQQRQLGTMISREGGFLCGIDRFDAAFFRLSAREARLMDPQQRLLLEVAWEALEHAGVAPDRLAGTRAGFFIGQFAHDYESLLLRANPGRDLDAHYATGNAAAVAAGRLAYFFGTHGPALAIDTACSSALVAVHLAARALRAGECDLALAGGVNLILAPELSICFSRAGMLSPDGRCRTFDAGATGYGRSEGCGLVVLKRLSKARTDGDRVMAVIRGSAVNQDGSSNGLTAPNGLAQEALIRAALADAGLDPLEVDFVETHGTGTPLGDPIEVEALAAVYAKGRSSERPLMLGAVKANIGHTEAAAGAAGLIKTALALESGWIAPQIHFDTPNPKLGLERRPLRIPVEPGSWPRAASLRRAAVSSFGFSGTNAHLVLEAASTPEAVADAADVGPWLLPLSAASPRALDQLTDRYAAWLDRHPDQDPGDVAGTAAVGRSHLRWRRTILASSSAELRRQMTTAAPMTEAGASPKTAFLFTGQGAQYQGMARQLYDSEPTFRDTVEHCAEALNSLLAPTLVEAIWGEGGGRLNETAWAQPALYAVECGLVALWRAWGIEPDIVLGHSVGAFAAAWTAGVISLADGARLVAERGRLMQALPEGGAMLAVMAEEDCARAACEAHARDVGIAAINAPGSVVISGRVTAVHAVGAALEQTGVRVVPLAVSHAFHSPLMDPVLAPFAAAVDELTLRSPRLTMISDTTGKVAGEEITTAAYWRRHLREPVRFQGAVAQAVACGAELFLEVGPQPTLLGLAKRCPEARDRAMLASLRPGEDDRRTLLESAAAFYRRGSRLNWDAITLPRRRLRLPTYPFERERHWFDAEPAYARPPATVATGMHPLLGTRLPQPGAAEARFTARFAATTLPFFDEHRLCGQIVVPAASHIGMALQGLAEIAKGPIVLEDLVFLRPLRLLDKGERTAQLVLDRSRSGGAWRLVTCEAGEEDEEAAWTLHATGRWRPGGLTDARPALTDQGGGHLQDRSGASFYAGFADAGYELGPSLRWIEALRIGENEVSARMRPYADDGWSWAFYPGLLDACFQIIGVWFGTERLKAAGELFVPYVIGEFALMAIPRSGEELHAQAKRRYRLGGNGPSSEDVVIADLRICGADGRLLAEARGFKFHRVGRGTLLGEVSPQEACFIQRWRQDRPVAAWLEGIDLADAVDGVEEIETLAARYARAALDQDVPASAKMRVWLQHWAKRAGQKQVDGDSGTDPALVPVRDLLARCGPELGRALRGEAKASELLFPDGRTEPLGSLYEKAPSFRRANAALAAVVSRLVERRPNARILELGAGTGGTTAAVLDALAGQPCSYLFTDVSPHFLQAATERFAGRAEFATAVLDLKRHPAEQGLHEASFDLVIAANVLHAMSDLRQSLAHAMALLTRGGWLLLLEGTAPRAWVDVTFGLTEGWWRFSDHDLRPDYPLLSAERWQSLLKELGFEAALVESPRGQLYDQALILARPQANPGRDLFLTGQGGVSSSLAARLVAAGLGVEVGEAGLAGRLREVGWRGLVDLRALDPGPVGENPGKAAERLTAGAVALAQALGGQLPVRLVTGGAVASAEDEPVPAPAQAALWGLAAAAALEEPACVWQRVDLDPAGAEAEWAAALTAELALADGEDRVAWRGQERRLARLTRQAGPGATDEFVTHGTWLVTGGLGGIGRTLGPWLRARGAQRVVLAGRQPGDTPKGCEACRLDVTDAGRVRELLRELTVAGSTLTGIVHAAGVLDDVPLAALDRTRLALVLGPKASGAWHLHEASLELAPALEQFVLFGSMAGVLGNAGQANHAAANAFLGSLAWHRRSRGLPAITVDWGAWDRIGAAASKDAQDRLARLGWRPMAPEAALDNLGVLLASGTSGQVAVADMVWNSCARLPIVRELYGKTASAASTPAARPVQAAAGRGIRRRLNAVSPRERLGLLENHLANLVGEVLGREETVDHDMGFFALGMDSLISIELRNRLQQHFEVSLPATIALDFPSVRSLARRLALALTIPVEEAAREPIAAAATPDTLAATVAGMSDAELESLIAAEFAAVQEKSSV